jgi:hypothetical protein
MGRLIDDFYQGMGRLRDDFSNEYKYGLTRSIVCTCLSGISIINDAIQVQSTKSSNSPQGHALA